MRSLFRHRTMGEIIPFVSRSNKTAQQNLAAFVCFARDQLTAFADGGAWDELTWRKDRVSAVFCKYRPRYAQRSSPVPLDEPFLTFAKSYFRYKYSHKPTVSTYRTLAALRLIERALIESTGRANILDLSVLVLDLSAQYCAEIYSSGYSRHQVGCETEAIAEFCRKQGFVTALPGWKAPFKKSPNLTETLTEEGMRHREKRMPTHHAMLALADLFARASSVESQLFTSIMILLMVAPSRISEVLALPVNCIGWEEDSAGDTQMYLRWRAAKGGGPMKKWVPTAMQSVVKEAVARLTRIGAPARKAARFAHDNPGRFMRHLGCATPENFGEDDELQPTQVAAALGVRCMNGRGWAGLPPMWAAMIDDGAVTYGRLAEKTLQLYKGHYWPYIDAKKEVPVWEALCLIREFECHKRQSARPFSWRLTGYSDIFRRMGGNAELSLFERAGIRNPDGSRLKLTPHQPRHWLSTMSLRAGMDDFTLARWAGRARVEDNQHYDHRTHQERSDELRALLRKDEPTTLEKFCGGLPVTYRELGVDRAGTAKATLYGMCLHDYTMTPCQKQRDCMTCNEHVCIKGEHVRLERIKRLEEMTARLLEDASQAAESGAFGADRWVDHRRWKLACVRTMMTLLELEPVPDGTVLRMPAEYDPSPVRRTLMERNFIQVPSSAEMPPIEVVPLIGESEDA